MIGESTLRALVNAANAPYRRAGDRPYRHARGKLSASRAFAAIWRLRLLQQRDHVINLGCGQDQLAVWLLGAHPCQMHGDCQRLLNEGHFSSEAMLVRAGTAFANALLMARAR
jgi:hypothetical protein